MEAVRLHKADRLKHRHHFATEARISGVVVQSGACHLSRAYCLGTVSDYSTLYLSHPTDTLTCLHRGFHTRGFHQICETGTVGGRETAIQHCHGRITLDLWNWRVSSETLTAGRAQDFRIRAVVLTMQQHRRGNSIPTLLRQKTAALATEIMLSMSAGCNWEGFDRAWTVVPASVAARLHDVAEGKPICLHRVGSCWATTLMAG